MNKVIDGNSVAGIYHALPKELTAQSMAARSSGFLDMVVQAGRGTTDVREISGRPKTFKAAETSNADAYLEHLKKKYGQVTIENIGKDQASLEKAGRHMGGRDVVIAPNILEEMAGDTKKALYYEQKIDYFFNTVIPQGNAICAARGLVFEPGGVVVHEDGTVTYICGCSDSPERVAEVNKINAEKARKKAEKQRQYQEQSAAAAAQRKAMLECTAQAAAQRRMLMKLRMNGGSVSAAELFLGLL